MLTKVVPFVLVIATIHAYATTNQTKIIYGEDDRFDAVDAPADLQKLAKSVAGMIPTNKLVKVNETHVMLPPHSLKMNMGLCPGERFEDQPGAMACSGFMIGDKLLATAGHCITSQADCDQMSWVFDYAVKAKSKRADVIVPKSKIFSCKKVLSAKLEVVEGKDMRDFSVIELDRSPKRTPLKLRQKGKITNRDKVFVIGHPSGLPTKITTNGSVFENDSPYSFKTNLDTFGGNSGSPVLNEKTKMVEGILVRGAKDYLETKCGMVVNKVDEDITGEANLGESVSRISEIKKYQK